jgi:hypothetical protein
MIKPARRLSVAVWLIPILVTFLACGFSSWFAGRKQGAEWQGYVVISEGQPQSFTVTNKGWTSIRFSSEGLSDIRAPAYAEFIVDSPIQINTPDGKIFNVNAERRCFQFVGGEWVEVKMFKGGAWSGYRVVDVAGLGKVPEVHVMVVWGNQ